MNKANKAIIDRMTLTPLQQQYVKLASEYRKLRTKLFGSSSFAVMDDKDKDWQRYNQLFQFFYPQFRTKTFESPIKNQ